MSGTTVLDMSCKCLATGCHSFKPLCLIHCCDIQVGAALRRWEQTRRVLLRWNTQIALKIPWCIEHLKAKTMGWLPDYG